MSKPLRTTHFERVAGSLPVEVAATVVAALAGGPLAALLPVLGKSLAATRQRQRVEGCLQEIAVVLKSQAAALREISDEQYKIVYEAILAALQTTQEGKFQMLQRVVANTLDAREIQPQEAVLLSRIVRDISADEALFVVQNYTFELMQIIDSETEHEANVLQITKGSPNELLVNGLLSIGVLTPGQPTFGQLLRFSQVTAKLIVLLKA